MSLALQELQKFKLTAERFTGVSDFSIDSAKSTCLQLAKTIESMQEKLGKIPSLKTPLNPEEVWSKFSALNFEMDQLSKLEIRTLLSSGDHAFREEILQELERHPQVFARFRTLYCFANQYFLLWHPPNNAKRVENLILRALEDNRFAYPLAKNWMNHNYLFSAQAASTLAKNTCEGRLAAFQLADQFGIGRHTKLCFEAGGAAATLAANTFKRLEPTFSREDSLRFLRWVSDHLLTEQTLLGPKSTLVATLILSQAAQQILPFRKGLLSSILDDPRMGDPRIIGNFANWNQIHESARARVIAWLADESIRFFFDIVLPDHNQNQRRKDFWLKYVDQIRDFRIALSKKDLSKVRLSVDLPTYLSYSLTDHNTTSAFLMRFNGYSQKSITVVEFSETPNAAYIYEDNNYPINFNLRSYRIILLKNQAKMSCRITHNHEWEWRAAGDLAAEFGIKP